MSNYILDNSKSIDGYGIFYPNDIEIGEYYDKNEATIQFGDFLIELIANNLIMLNDKKVERVMFMIMDDKIRVDMDVLKNYYMEADKIILAIDAVLNISIIEDSKFTN